MKIAFLCTTILAMLATGAFAQRQEEVETYLVAPYTMDKTVTVAMADGKKVEGKVTRGDDDKISVEQKGGPIELSTNQIESIRIRRPKRSNKMDFVGNLLGGIGFGFAGAEIGKKAGEAIRSDGNPGKIGPIVGGIVFGFGGGYIGRTIVRHMVSEEVTLKVLRGEPTRTTTSTTGSITLPSPAQSAALTSANSPR